MSSTAIRTPFPSPARVVRSGSAFGSRATRAVEPGPPWIRGSPWKLIAFSPTKTWLGATRAGPCARVDVALRMRASASSTSRAGSSGFCGARWKEVTPNGRTSPGFQPVRTFCTSAASPGPTRIWPGRRRNGFFSSRLTATRRGSHCAGSSLMRATLSDVGVADKAAVREAGGVLELADDAVRLASADARAARRLAEEALAAADDAETRSTAERALGLAAVELGDAAAAVEHFRRAIAIAEAAGLRRRAAEARMSLALALTLTGASAEALAEADRAEPDLEGAARARLQGQRAVILQKLGRLDEALEGYRRPLAAFRRAGDVLWEARLLCNRGVLQVYRGAVGSAESDFLRAETLHESIGQALAATQVRHNLGWVAARRGDVPAALDWYDRVEAEYRAHGVPLALLLMDRCEVLLSARLAAEARENAEAAVAELDAAGLDADLAEARLLAAHADLLAGDAAAARDQADRADAAFTRQHRPAWAALARAAAARAAWLEAERDGDEARLEAALAAAQRALRTLDGVEALDARLIAGRAAIELGRPRLGRRQLELAAAARHRGPVQVRTRAWHAAALERLARGDRRGANAAIAAGLRALEAHRMTLGATELRAHASGHGEELAMLGLRLAVESGSAERVLAGAERLRAAGLLRRAARPPDDEELAADLIELRRVTAALDESLREGRPDQDLLRRQAALEASVRRRARRARGARRRRCDDEERAVDLRAPGAVAGGLRCARRAVAGRDRRRRAGAAAGARRRRGHRARGGVVADEPAQPRDGARRVAGRGRDG